RRRYADAEQQYRNLISLSSDNTIVDDAHLGLGTSLLRQGKWNEGVDELKELFLARIRHLRTPDAVELRKAWAGLANLSVSQDAARDQDGLYFDGDREYVVLPSVQFDGRPPWTLEVIVKYVDYDGSPHWSKLISAAYSGSIQLQPQEQKWEIALYT